jgi:hypothetical protein
VDEELGTDDKNDEPGTASESWESSTPSTPASPAEDWRPHCRG